MKKYKLKKDLPLAKAGTIVQVDFGKSFPKIYENKERNFKIIGVVDMDTMDKWLEEVPEKPKSVWELKGGDSLYFIGSQDIICKGTWDVCNLFLREREIGLIFLTREEAEEELKKRKAIQRIKKYCWENDIELADSSYKNNKENWKIEICYNVESGRFEISQVCRCIYVQEFIFKNEEDAQQIIKNCEDDLKIIFNV